MKAQGLPTKTIEHNGITFTLPLSEPVDWLAAPLSTDETKQMVERMSALAPREDTRPVGSFLYGRDPSRPGKPAGHGAALWVVWGNDLTQEVADRVLAEIRGE